MTPTYQTTPVYESMGWLARAEAWLDSKGKGAWIALMVLGFIFVWPVGLAILAYMIWSKRMFSCKSRSTKTSWTPAGFGAMTSSGNSAFDAYKADTLRRLEQEQQDFKAFLQRLRDAKDKAEFDQFMDDRARANRADAADDSDDKA
ncbi:MAG: DUF2852 domain-containing protein [Marinibacterium sp.]|nr:DUF2852 domain-containing protein [Marinibacterium sp.]